MGHLIPAGTGFHQHRDTQIEFTVEEPEPVKPEPEEENLLDEDGQPIPKSMEDEEPSIVATKIVDEDETPSEVIEEQETPSEATEEVETSSEGETDTPSEEASA